MFSKALKILTLVTLALYFAGAVFFFSSCERDKLPDKPITVQVQTQGLIIQPLTKSFSVDEWIFNYNPNQYELKFTGEKGNVYTYQKSITELQNGFPITVMPDNYSVTYESLHNQTVNAPLDDKLDISINEIKNINTVTPVILNANNDDYLVILDNNSITAIIWNQINGEPAYFYNSPEPDNQSYKYMYCNIEGDVSISYKGSDNIYKTKIIPNATKNNIYHIVGTFNGETNINILPFKYNVIGW